MTPDLDLDLVEEEAREEEKRREEENKSQKKEEERRRRKEEEEEERRRRSQTVRQMKRDNQIEQGRRSRSLSRNGAQSWDAFQLEEQMEVEESGGRTRERRSRTKSRRREKEAGREGVEENEEERDISTTCHAKDSGSSAAGQTAAFSFLMPIDNGERLSDSESAASFSEVSLSAASIATTGWREDSDWRRAQSPRRQGSAPGPWLKPSPQRLTQVLIGSRLSGRELAGGLSF